MLLRIDMSLTYRKARRLPGYASRYFEAAYPGYIRLGAVLILGQTADAIISAWGQLQISCPHRCYTAPDFLFPTPAG